MTGISINFAKHQLTLLADKAIWWADRSALLLSDVHLGKGEIFRRHGIAIPAGDTSLDLERMASLLERFGAKRLLVLGDLIHGPPSNDLIEVVGRWRSRFPGVAMHLISGNHDRYLPLIPPGWEIESTPDMIIEGLLLAHEPSEPGPPEDASAEIVGHIHPAVRLRSGRHDSVRAPVFWVQPKRLVLPSFGSFTGGHLVSPARGDRVFAVGPDQVIEVPVGRRQQSK